MHHGIAVFIRLDHDRNLSYLVAGALIEKEDELTSSSSVLQLIQWNLLVGKPEQLSLIDEKGSFSKVTQKAQYDPGHLS